MTPSDTVEERLQRSLTEVADSTRVSPEAWAEVERRARRRRAPRVVLALAAALSVVVIAVVAVALVTRDGGPRITTADDPVTACGIAPPADVEVMLDPDASPAQRDAVQQMLEGSPSVSKTSFQSQEEGARIFRCVFAEEPEDLATANLARIPPMFHVTLVEGADPAALIRRLEAEPGVSDAGPGNCSTPADLEVFFVVNPTPEQIAAAEGVVQQSPGVADTVFVSKEDAYREFACLFVDEPDLLEATTPAALPPSIRIDLAPGADASGLIQQFEALAGVDAVAESRYPIAMPLPELETQTSSPTTAP